MRKSIVAALAALAAFAPAKAFSCAVCFGDPASPLTQGAKAGIIFLAVMVYMVVMTMGGVALFWWSRARKLAAMESAPVPVAASEPPPAGGKRA